jgi:hypothetical protein
MTADIKAVAAGSTANEKPTNYTRLPEDAGKVKTDILPGLSLIRYSRGYTALRLKSKGKGGRKTEVGRPLYRDDLLALGRALMAEAEVARSYDEAHSKEEVMPF